MSAAISKTTVEEPPSATEVPRPRPALSPLRLRGYLLALMAVWTLVTALSLKWNLSLQDQEILDLALNAARAGAAGRPRRLLIAHGPPVQERRKQSGLALLDPAPRHHLGLQRRH